MTITIATNKNSPKNYILSRTYYYFRDSVQKIDCGCDMVLFYGECEKTDSGYYNCYQ